MIDRFSHSGLSSYEKCPAQFRIRYIDRVAKQDEGIEAFMGKRVHEALESLYNKILAGQTPILDTVLDKYDALWMEHWHDRIAIVKREPAGLVLHAWPGITETIILLIHR